MLRSGVSFTQAIATTSFTSPSVASILTGLYPFHHWVSRFWGDKLNPKCTTLGEELKKEGYATCAMVTGPLFPQVGFNRGFEKYLFRKESETIYTHFKTELEDFVERAGPWFLFVHLWELHHPIYLPSHSKHGFSLNKYDNALCCLDHQLADILEKVDLDETIVVLLSDHGEKLPSSLESIQKNLIAFLRNKMSRKVWRKFSEKIFEASPQVRKIQGHGFHLYEELIRIPLIFAGKGVPENKSVRKQVGHIDIFPTIVDLLELRAASSLQRDGISLIPLINNEELEDRSLYIGPAGIHVDSGERLEGLRTPKWKYIECNNKPVELYNLENDPRELDNLIYSRKNVVKRLRNKLNEMKSSKIDTFKGLTQSEKEKIRRLKTLGKI